MFASPSVNTIAVCPDFFQNSDLSLLPILGAEHPDLKEVELRGPGLRYDETTHGHIRSFLSNLNQDKPQLETVLLPNVDEKILEYLSCLPSLKCLVIDELCGFDSFFGSFGSEKRFLRLENLSLWSTTPEVALGILGTGDRAAFTEVAFTFKKSYPTSETTRRLYDAIVARCSMSTLRSLTVNDEFMYSKSTDMLNDEDCDNYVVSPTTLHTLFRFTNLTTIVLKPYFGFDLNDTVVSELARAWIQVESLSVGFSYDCHSTFATQATLVGLQAIATHCSRLENLDFCFNAKRVPPLETTNAQTMLHTFDVRCSPISSPKVVAKFLSTLFPNLTSLSYGCTADESNPVDACWKEVRRLLCWPPSQLEGTMSDGLAMSDWEGSSADGEFTGDWTEDEVDDTTGSE
ncbi:hypothetical protein B0H15DRAFT_989223 [Mycena belliarum]|uniref:Uncharacterized protein n=1 Tax=Mycena belliarum TaxID=1033014 RepID=A0AAD6U2D0_9AGAR|nr:hypothetical protein B0H15DRAFT_989223 [Mycena belliae]